MKNVFQNIPYTDGQMGRQQLVNTKDLLVMQVALKPGQQVPEHNANSNVHLLVIEGELSVTLAGNEELFASKGTLLPIAYKTPMVICNKAKENASFLIFKSPNPSAMEH